MKLLYSPSIRKVVGIAVLLFILELNMIALYTYTMVDHPQNEAHHKPKDSIVRVKRIVNVVTGLLPGGSLHDSLGETGSGEVGGAIDVTHEKLKKTSNITSKVHRPPPRLLSVTPHPPRPKPHKHVDRPSPEPPTIKISRHPPTVVIMGAKCAGISTLTQLMKLHPQLKLVNDTFGKIVRRNYTQVNDTRAVKTGQILVDVSTDLLTTSHLSASLRKSIPHLKFILMFRDPLDHSLACYHKLINRLDGSGTRSFEDFVLNTKGKINRQSELITDSLYDIHLSEWLNHYNISQWLFLDYYQLTTQPFRTLKRLEKFLGVQPFYRMDDFTYNKQQSLCLSQKLLKKFKLTTPLCWQANSNVSEVSLGADTEDQLKDYFLPHMERVLSLVSSQIYLGDLVSLMN